MAQLGSGPVGLGRARPPDLGCGQECQAQFDGHQQAQGPRGGLQGAGPVEPLEEGERTQR